MRDAASETLRGFIGTPSGARIPVVVFLQPSTRTHNYSQVGQISIPDARIDEFEEDTRKFFFRGENGECFTQFHVLDELGQDAEPKRKVGRLILLRDFITAEEHQKS